MGKYTWLLDAGHGGIINNEYQTSGKRSPNWHKGVYYEGVGNRDFVKRILKGLERFPVKCIPLHWTQEDVPLAQRTAIVNDLYKYNKSIRLISIHSNAGGGTGFEVFTSVGESESDLIATVYAEETQKLFPNIKFRSDWDDKDPDKEANFWVLTKSHCPAILTENLFMDNEHDYNLLWDKKIRDKIALIHIHTILRYEGIMI